MRIGVDSGGTFTDVVAVDDEGQVQSCKLPSQPAAPWQSVCGGVERLAAGRVVDELAHATTVATNALLERQGGPVLLVTTLGFADVLEIGRQTRPQLYALHPTRPPPLVPAPLRLELDERLCPDGSVLRAPAAEALIALREAAAVLAREHAVRAVAVCLLHAYVNPRHEQAVAAALAPLGLPVSLSSEVLPLWREYERTSTTVVDAYVRPVVAPYLQRLDGVAGRVRILASNGGAMAAGEAAARPVRTLLSGPAAGAIGARAVAAAVGVADAITLDMGGTSTDVALLRGGELALSDEANVADCVLQLPMLAIHSVGAGGGSIAWRDPGGALKVGPRSAGAEPGPAAYDRGGREPTVTDANLLLGRLPGLLGGAMPLSRERAATALSSLAGALGLDPLQTAEGVVAVAVAVMARAIKTISVERGYDPADFTLLPYGGAGGLHGCLVARELGMTRVLVPPSPGLLCAWGALVAEAAHDFVVTVLQPIQEVSGLAGRFASLWAAGHRALDADGVAASARRYGRTATLRYQGQSFALTVPIDDFVGTSPPGDAALDAARLETAFVAAHQDHYGYTLDRPVELVTLRLRAVGPRPKVALPREPVERGPAELSRVRLRLEGADRDAPLLSRRRLPPGAILNGPALLTEYSSTTLIPPGAKAEVLPEGALSISLA